jgi:lipopolysaccharide export LptBFGC system permease protein LptF
VVYAGTCGCSPTLGKKPQVFRTNRDSPALQSDRGVTMIFRAVRHTVFSEWVALLLLAIVASLFAFVGVRLPGSLLVVLGIILMIAVYLIRYGARRDRR